MNERIKQLAEQADIQFYKSYVPETGFKYEGAEVTVEDLEKFAELVVLECMKVSRKADGLDAEYAAWYLIQQHFGIEE